MTNKYLYALKASLDASQDKTSIEYCKMLNTYIQKQRELVTAISNQQAADHVKQNRLDTKQDDLEKDNERYLDNEGLER